MERNPAKPCAEAALREPRWPVALAILLVLALLLFMPARVRLLPSWALCAAGAVLEESGAFVDDDGAISGQVGCF